MTRRAIAVGLRLGAVALDQNLLRVNNQVQIVL